MESYKTTIHLPSKMAEKKEHFYKHFVRDLFVEVFN